MAQAEQMAAGYDFSAAAYDRIMGDWLGKGAREMARQLPPLREGAHVLDVACGTGIALLELMACQPQIAGGTGLDLSREMLGRARKRAETLGWTAASWVQGDARSLPFADSSFDAVISHTSLHLIPDWQLALAEMTRVLKPGGTLAVRCFNHHRIPEWRRLFEAVRQEDLAHLGVGALNPWPTAREMEEALDALPLSSYRLTSFREPQRIDPERLFAQTSVTLGFWQVGLDQRVIAKAQEALLNALTQAAQSGKFFCTAGGLEISAKKAE